MAAIILSWSANPAADNVVAYDVYGADGTGVVFGSCTLLASVSATTWTDSGLPNAQARTYYVVARNAVGSSSPDGPLNIATGAATVIEQSGFGFFVGGLMNPGELLGGGIFPVDVVFPGSFHPSEIVSKSPATNAAVIRIFNEDTNVQVGSITWAAGGTVGVITWSPSPYTLPAGQRLWLFAPSVADPTLAFINASVQGTPA